MGYDVHHNIVADGILVTCNPEKVNSALNELRELIDISTDGHLVKEIAKITEVIIECAPDSAILKHETSCDVAARIMRSYWDNQASMKEAT